MLLVLWSDSQAWEVDIRHLWSGMAAADVSAAVSMSGRCWCQVSPETDLIQAAEREEGRQAEASWQTGDEPEGLIYSLVVTIKLLMCRYAQLDPNISPRVWGQEGAEKAVVHHGIPALLSCLLSQPLPKTLVAADWEQRAVSVLCTARKSVKTSWWKCRKNSQREKCQLPPASVLRMLWEHLQFLWALVSLRMNSQGLSPIQV